MELSRCSPTSVKSGSYLRPVPNHVERRLTDGAPSRTALGLPIDGNWPQRGLIDERQAMPIHQRGDPIGETRLEGQRVEQAEDAAEGVMRWDAPWQGEKYLEPVDLRM